MASDIDICNLALAKINVDPVSDIVSPQTKEERLCRLMYPVAIDATLRKQSWNFATKYRTLAIVAGESFDAYLFVYALPSDCVMARNIVSNLGRTEEIPYEIIVNEAGTQKLLLTDEENCQLAYTSNAISTTLFDPQFVEALTWKLASDLSVPFKASPETQASLAQAFTSVLGDAMNSDATEGKQRPFEKNTIVEARGSVDQVQGGGSAI